MENSSIRLIQSFLKQIGVKEKDYKSLTQDDVKKLYEESDISKDGNVSLEEFAVKFAEKYKVLGNDEKYKNIEDSYKEAYEDLVKNNPDAKEALINIAKLDGDEKNISQKDITNEDSAAAGSNEANGSDAAGGASGSSGNGNADGAGAQAGVNNGKQAATAPVNPIKKEDIKDKNVSELQSDRSDALSGLREAQQAKNNNEAGKAAEEKKEAYDEMVKNLSSEDEEIQKQIEDIQTRKSENDKAISEKQTAINQINTNIDTKQGEIDAKQGEIDALVEPQQGDYTKEETKTVNGETVTETVPDTEAYNAAMAEYEAQKAALEEEKAALEDELTNLQQELETAESELAELETNGSEIDAELQELLQSESASKIENAQETLKAMQEYQEAEQTYKEETAQIDENIQQYQENLNVLDETINEKRAEELKNADKEDENNPWNNTDKYSDETLAKVATAYEANKKDDEAGFLDKAEEMLSADKEEEQEKYQNIVDSLVSQAENNDDVVDMLSNKLDLAISNGNTRVLDSIFNTAEENQYALSKVIDNFGQEKLSKAINEMENIDSDVVLKYQESIQKALDVKQQVQEAEKNINAEQSNNAEQNSDAENESKPLSLTRSELAEYGKDNGQNDSFAAYAEAKGIDIETATMEELQDAVSKYDDLIAKRNEFQELYKMFEDNETLAAELKETLDLYDSTEEGNTAQMSLEQLQAMVDKFGAIGDYEEGSYFGYNSDFEDRVTDAIAKMKDISKNYSDKIQNQVKEITDKYENGSTKTEVVNLADKYKDIGADQAQGDSFAAYLEAKGVDLNDETLTDADVEKHLEKYNELIEQKEEFMELYDLFENSNVPVLTNFLSDSINLADSDSQNGVDTDLATLQSWINEIGAFRTEGEQGSDNYDKDFEERVPSAIEKMKEFFEANKSSLSDEIVTKYESAVKKSEESTGVKEPETQQTTGTKEEEETKASETDSGKIEENIKTAIQGLFPKLSEEDIDDITSHSPAIQNAITELLDDVENKTDEEIAQGLANVTIAVLYGDEKQLKEFADNYKKENQDKDFSAYKSVTDVLKGIEGGNLTLKDAKAALLSLEEYDTDKLNARLADEAKNRIDNLPDNVKIQNIIADVVKDPSKIAEIFENLGLTSQEDNGSRAEEPAGNTSKTKNEEVVETHKKEIASASDDPEKFKDNVQAAINDKNLSVDEKMGILEYAKEQNADTLNELLAEDDSFYMGAYKDMVESKDSSVKDLFDLQERYFALQGDNKIDDERFYGQFINNLISLYEKAANDEAELALVNDKYGDHIEQYLDYIKDSALDDDTKTDLTDKLSAAAKTEVKSASEEPAGTKDNTKEKDNDKDDNSQKDLSSDSSKMTTQQGIPVNKSSKEEVEEQKYEVKDNGKIVDKDGNVKGVYIKASDNDGEDQYYLYDESSFPSKDYSVSENGYYQYKDEDGNMQEVHETTDIDKKYTLQAKQGEDGIYDILDEKGNDIGDAFKDSEEDDKISYFVNRVKDDTIPASWFASANGTYFDENERAMTKVKGAEEFGTEGEDYNIKNDKIYDMNDNLIGRTIDNDGETSYFKYNKAVSKDKVEEPAGAKKAVSIKTVYKENDKLLTATADDEKEGIKTGDKYVVVEEWKDSHDDSFNDCLSRIIANSYDLKAMGIERDSAEYKELMDVICKANKIDNPDVIYTADKIVLPEFESAKKKEEQKANDSDDVEMPAGNTKKEEAKESNALSDNQLKEINEELKKTTSDKGFADAMSKILNSSDISVNDKMKILQNAKEDPATSSYVKTYLSENDTFFVNTFSDMIEDEKTTVDDVINFKEQYREIEDYKNNDGNVVLQISNENGEKNKYLQSIVALYEKAEKSSDPEKELDKLNNNYRINYLRANIEKSTMDDDTKKNLFERIRKFE